MKFSTKPKPAHEASKNVNVNPQVAQPKVSTCSTSNKLTSNLVVSRDQIAKRAYQLWEARGRKHGNDQADWKQAELELCQGRCA